MSGLLLCLATRKGYEVLRALGADPNGRALHVCTFRETNVVESSHEAILGLAAELGLKTVSWKAFRDDPVAYLESHGITAMLCIGWRYLIGREVVAHLAGEVVIAHDSLLPKFRGFAPLVTAMIVGEAEAGVTLLRAGAATDDGPILWQGAVPILPTDTIADLIGRTSALYVDGARRYLRGELRESRPQDHSQATYSLWRDADDLRIDWAEDAGRIERTVRALGPPYLGARTTLGDRPVVVHRAETVEDLPFAVRQPGKVWSLDPDGRPVVVCGRGLLRVVEATSGGRSVLPLKALRRRFS